MSLVTIPTIVWPPILAQMRQDASGTSSLVIDATGEKAATVFQVPRTGSIDRLVFFTRTVTTPQTLRVGLYTVDASGDPTTTAYGGMAVGTQASPAANTQYEVTLATPASAVLGDMVAMVVEFDSTVGNLGIGYWDNPGLNSTMQVPYLDHFTTAWAKSGFVSGMGIRYSDGTYEFIGTWATGIRTDVFFANGSTPDERGNVILLPMRCRSNGAFVMGGANAVSADYEIVLYGPSGQALRTIVRDADASGIVSGTLYARWDTPVVLEPEVPYRLTVKPTTANNCNVREHSVLNAAMMGCLPGGTRVYKTSRTDLGAFTDVTTTRTWWLSLMIDQVDDGMPLPRTRPLHSALI